MAVTIVADAGASNANSYATRVFADAFNQTTEFAAVWEGAEGPDKDVALVRFTRILDQLSYRGQPATDTQALLWPRRGVYKKTLSLWSETEVPVVLQQMTAYGAAYLLATANAADASANPFTDTGADALSSLSVGSIALAFRENAGTEGVRWFEQAIVGTLAAHGLVFPLGTVRLVR